MKRITTIAILLSMAVAAAAQDVPQRYEIKSGKVKTIIETMGQVSEVVSYFDDYGNREIAMSSVSIPGQGEIEMATILNDGKFFMVNYSARQVQETPLPESINYLAITDAIREKYKIINVGAETIGDKECIKYIEEVSQMGHVANATVWVWKGYVIKMVTRIGEIQIAAEVTELEEETSILPSLFDVPEF